MPIRIRVVSGFLFAVVMLVVLGVINFTSLTDLRYVLGLFVDEDVPAVIALENLRTNGAFSAQTATEIVLFYTLEADADEIAAEEQQLTTAIADTRAALDAYETLQLGSGTAPTTLEPLQQQTAALLQSAATFAALGPQGAERETIEAALEAFEDVETAFNSVINDLRAQQSMALARANEEVSGEIDGNLSRTLVFGVITIVLTLGAGYWLGREITLPVVKLTRTSEQLASGDLSERSDIERTDEIGKLATAFNSMADQLNQRIQEAQDAAAEAQRASNAKSAFLASVSHELRTPLNTIINFSKFVSRGVMGPTTEKQQDALAKVVRNGEHLLDLINDVLDMSKIESGSLNLFLEEDILLQDIIADASSIVEAQLAEKPVHYRVAVPVDLPPLYADRKRVRQIVTNILSNACKFTEQGEIVVAAQRERGGVLLTIRDSGSGIDPADRDAVFEAFQQTERGLRQGDGTGLGMPIAKRLAEAHGGQLWFESTLGGGTTFFVRLPLRVHEAPTEPQPVPILQPEVMA